MLPAIDMINHSTDPSLRCTTLQKMDAPMSIEASMSERE